ncbi:hypothetical protein [Nonomuraea indica]|uniref:Ig-like domain-containing protein n=1 Tax=Nonomuraea indica TaxID=1581193 RepID=A0ABW8A950_9ACTN
MENTRDGIAGFRLTQHTWHTELGNWIDAISPDGRRAGALLFDPRVIGLPGVRERVVAAVLADQRLVAGGTGGLILVADVVAAGEQVWLLTAQAVSPTLADLLAAARLDAGGAVAVLVDTAHTLLALHAAGVTHGSLHPRTVVVGADGVALLSERGLADAVRGHLSPPGNDVAAWASLARSLAASLTGGTAGPSGGPSGGASGGAGGTGGPSGGAGGLSGAGGASGGTGGASGAFAGGADGASGGPGVVELVERAATTATGYGLAAARDLLLGGRGTLPGGVISREGLIQAARGRSAFARQSPDERPPAYGVVPRDEGDIVTLLHVPGSGTGGAPGGSYSGGGTGGSSGGGTGGGTGGAMGGGAGGGTGNGGGSGPVRFGPGVETRQGTQETTAERIWREGRAEAETLQRAGTIRDRAARARRRRTVVSAAVLAVVVAGAILAWFKLGDTPALTVASIEVEAPKKTQGCDSAVVVKGTIVTNGAPGEVTYEWRKSTDDEVVRQTLRTASDRTTYEVPLRWRLKGRSTVKATATLVVLSPGPRMTDKASFTYKC